MTEAEKDYVKQLEDRLYCLESIITHVSEGVILTDQDCRITVFNPAKERMEQMKSEDVMGMISWEAYTHSNREISEHQQVSDTKQPILNAYRPHAYVNNIPVYIYYSTYPVVRDGSCLGSIPSAGTRRSCGSCSMRPLSRSGMSTTAASRQPPGPTWPTAPALPSLISADSLPRPRR